MLLVESLLSEVLEDGELVAITLSALHGSYVVTKEVVAPRQP